MGITSASGVKRSADVMRWCLAPSSAVRSLSTSPCPDATSAWRLTGIPPLAMTTAVFRVRPTKSRGIPVILMLKKAKSSRSA